MTNFKNYFIYHLKSNLKALTYILASVLVLTFVVGMNAQPQPYYSDKEFSSTLYIPVIFLCILSYVLPVMEFSFFKKRVSLDCAFALPISRRTIGCVHYLTGLILLLGTFTLSYLLNFILLLSRGPGHFNFTPAVAHYFLCLILGSAFYSLMVFVFNEANTKGDGIWFMILYTFAFVLILGTIVVISDKYDMYIDANAYLAIPWGFISFLTTSYQEAVDIYVSSADFWRNPEYVGWFIFWIAAGVASAVGFFLTFGKRRTEKTEEISDSFLGYRVLIPTFATTGMIIFEASEIFIFWIIIELLALIGYTVYRRGFNYKKSDLAVLLLLLIFLII